MEKNDRDREKHIRQMEKQAQIERAKAEDRTGIDREVERELQRVRPGSDAPSRAGVSPTGTGADNEGRVRQRGVDSR
jgi:hypothetical protein